MRHDDIGHCTQVAVDKGDDLGGLQALTERGETADIGHHDGNPAQVAAQFQALWPLQDVGDDLVRQVAPEGGADEFLVALQLQPVLLLAVVPALALDARLDAGLQQHRVEGLEQVIVGARLDALDDAVHVLAAGDHDNGGCPPFGMLFYPVQYLVAVHAGHHQVQQYHVHVGLLQGLEGLLATGGGHHDMPTARQVAGDQLAVLLQVVHRQDKTRLGGNGAALAAVAVGLTALAGALYGLEQSLQGGIHVGPVAAYVLAQHLGVAADRRQHVHQVVGAGLLRIAVQHALETGAALEQAGEIRAAFIAQLAREAVVQLAQLGDGAQ